MVISNRANALPLERAQERGIRAVFVDPKEFISKCSMSRK